MTLNEIKEDVTLDLLGLSLRKNKYIQVEIAILINSAICVLHFPLIIPFVIGWPSVSFHITSLKKVALDLHFLFLNDCLMSASCDTVWFDFYAIPEICSLLLTNHISVVFRFLFIFFFFSFFFCLFCAWDPFITMGSFIALQDSSPCVAGNTFIKLIWFSGDSFSQSQSAPWWKYSVVSSITWY